MFANCNEHCDLLLSRFGQRDLGKGNRVRYWGAQADGRVGDERVESFEDRVGDFDNRGFETGSLPWLGAANL